MERIEKTYLDKHMWLPECQEASLPTLQSNIYENFNLILSLNLDLRDYFELQ